MARTSLVRERRLIIYRGKKHNCDHSWKDKLDANIFHSANLTSGKHRDPHLVEPQLFRRIEQKVESPQSSDLSRDSKNNNRPKIGSEER